MKISDNPEYLLGYQAGYDYQKTHTWATGQNVMDEARAGSRGHAPGNSWLWGFTDGARDCYMASKILRINQEFVLSKTSSSLPKNSNRLPY